MLYSMGLVHFLFSLTQDGTYKKSTAENGVLESCFMIILDEQEIQCYVCKRYGHLCCVDFPDIRESRQISCYKCGHLGHLGSVSHTC